MKDLDRQASIGRYAGLGRELPPIWLRILHLSSSGQGLEKHD